MRDGGPLCRKGAPLMISIVFAVAVSWIRIRKKVANISSAFP